MVTVPCSPSSSTVTPEGTSSRPPTATTQGRPSWRAMIAVWLGGPPRGGARAGGAGLAGDDRGVAGRAAEAGGQPDDAGGVQSCRVGGSEVVGEQDRRHVGARDAGLP